MNSFKGFTNVEMTIIPMAYQRDPDSQPIMVEAAASLDHGDVDIFASASIDTPNTTDAEIEERMLAAIRSDKSPPLRLSKRQGPSRSYFHDVSKNELCSALQCSVMPWMLPYGTLRARYKLANEGSARPSVSIKSSQILCCRRVDTDGNLAGWPPAIIPRMKPGKFNARGDSVWPWPRSEVKVDWLLKIYSKAHDLESNHYYTDDIISPTRDAIRAAAWEDCQTDGTPVHEWFSNSWRSAWERLKLVSDAA